MANILSYTGQVRNSRLSMRKRLNCMSLHVTLACSTFKFTSSPNLVDTSKKPISMTLHAPIRHKRKKTSMPQQQHRGRAILLPGENFTAALPLPPALINPTITKLSSLDFPLALTSRKRKKPNAKCRNSSPHSCISSLPDPGSASSGVGGS